MKLRAEKYSKKRKTACRQGRVIDLTSDQAKIRKIVEFDGSEPFAVLGPHYLEKEGGVVVRAFLPRATEAWVRTNGKTRKTRMTRVHSAGFFCAFFKGQTELLNYKIGFRDDAGYIEEHEDPYAFSTEISNYDLYLIGEGTHYKSYEKFGARVRTFKGVSGVHFAVWAPNARSVSVVGNFNHWRVGAHPMNRVHFSSGVWSLFIPRLCEGEVYKYAIRSSLDRQIRLKADPYARQAELRPQTASVVTTLSRYAWRDGKWLSARSEKNPLKEPVSIYEVHLGSWRRNEKNDWGFLNYRELAHQLVEYVKMMGYTHIELLPVMEHPLDESWGYQVVNYYAPTSRFGKPEDFMYFIDHCHQHDIGVILDWVPAHFPKDAHGLIDFDGDQIYAYGDWRKAEHKDWGTLVFDYEKREVKNFLISNALFWLEKYHIDGLRVDAVASMLYLDYSKKPGEWEPNVHGGRENLEAVTFFKQFNEIVHREHPGIMTIAEESTAWPGVSRPTHLGGLGFSMKWNMGWMHDMLEYFSKDPIYRKYHHKLMTFPLLYAFSENFVLPISHDEVVHGKGSLLEKMPGDDWQKFANLRLFLGVMFANPGKKLLFMSNDLGQRSEWNSQASLDWHLMNFPKHRRLNLLVRDLHRIYKENRAFWEMDFEPDGFEWVDFSDVDAGVFVFLRWSQDRKQCLLFACNMTPVVRTDYRVGVPKPGYYKEILNSDAWEYGGSGIGNLGGIQADGFGWHKHRFSINVQLPPLGICVLKHEDA